MCPTGILGALEKINIRYLCRDSNTGPSSSVASSL